MPHCIIEYSAPLAQQFDINALVQAVHQGAINSALFESSAIKSRSYGSEHSQIGMLADGSFIHLTFRIMPGRTDAQKQHLTQSVYQAMASLTASVNSITMEVHDLVPEHYFKRSIPCE